MDKDPQGGLYNMVRENLDLARENNKLLRKMRRSARWAFIFRLMWIAIIIGVPVYLYIIFLQPHVGDISESYSGFRESLDALRAIFEQLQSVNFDALEAGRGAEPTVPE